MFARIFFLKIIWSVFYHFQFRFVYFFELHKSYWPFITPRLEAEPCYSEQKCSLKNRNIFQCSNVKLHIRTYVRQNKRFNIWNIVCWKTPSQMLSNFVASFEDFLNHFICVLLLNNLREIVNKRKGMWKNLCGPRKFSFRK